MDRLIVIHNTNEIYIINTKLKTISLNTKENEKIFTFEKMDKIAQDTKSINRINKPYILLAYIDYKNNSLNKWQDKTIIKI